ncbi:MAG: phosphoglycerate kinase [Candidatus Zixiibacteriota bacterium]|nr:MAG: phosphoglycerate kinase [candidate division Zixibacteria bacterium]
MRRVEELEVAGKVVFLRTEFNVALDENYNVVDDSRIRASLPTIQHLCDNGAKLVICSHIGRPWGKPDKSKSLCHLVEPLVSLLGRPVMFSADCIGPERQSLQERLQATDILLLENVRFYSEENDNDEAFSKQLASGVDIYVNDAFGNSHRPHASMIGVPKMVSQKAVGILVNQELNAINSFLTDAAHPAVAIIGGAKVAGKDGKIHVIRNLLKSMDYIVVVGKISYYFLEAVGQVVGSTISADRRQIDAPGSDIASAVDDCTAVIDLANEMGKEIFLPLDSVVVTPSGDQPTVIIHGEDTFPSDGVAYDLGPRTLQRILNLVSQAGSVVWNGPLGYIEDERFRNSTVEVARKIGESRAKTLVGGGDTLTVLPDDSFSFDHIHVCTGGGAMLTMLMGRDLIAIRALEEG